MRLLTEDGEILSDHTPIDAAGRNLMHSPISAARRNMPLYSRNDSANFPVRARSLTGKFWLAYMGDRSLPSPPV